MHLDDDGELVLDREDVSRGGAAARQRRRPRVSGRGAADRMSAAAIRRIVVVGNGIAGLTAADSLRDAGFDGELTIVGDERHRAYSRPALSKALLSDGADTSSHRLPAPTHGARELVGVRASGLDRERRRVTLDDGDRASVRPSRGGHGLAGASPLRASPASSPCAGSTTRSPCATVSPARPSVVVVGGGPLGMEVASACLAAGCRRHARVPGHATRAAAGPLPRPDLRRRRARPGRSASSETRSARLEGHDGATGVVLDEGAVLEAELVVSAVGDVPNTEWLAGTGLVSDGVVRVDRPRTGAT